MFYSWLDVSRMISCMNIVYTCVSIIVYIYTCKKKNSSAYVYTHIQRYVQMSTQRGPQSSHLSKCYCCCLPKGVLKGGLE